MDGTQVTFGRRGLPHDSSGVNTSGRAGPIRISPPSTSASPVLPAFAGAQPDTLITRSLLKTVLLTFLLSAVILLTAGSSKHGHDLPYWLRTGAEFRASNFIFPILFCAVAAVFFVTPVLVRPVAFRLYASHFDYQPVIGWARSIRWSEIADISIVGWGKYKRLVVETKDGKKLRIYGSALSLSRRELMELLLTRRATAGVDFIALGNGTIDQQYLLPGH